MLAWLRSVKMARRETEPDLDVIGELFRAAAGKFKCPGCGAVGLDVREVEELDDEAWGMARKCESCGKPVDPERVELFPDARLCVACQRKADTGQDDAPADYCPRCGGRMTLRRASQGVTRYRLYCPACRR
jgi:predicted RNA-binding Zn-ribbon protein involved in translation (DUF1610 family)